MQFADRADAGRRLAQAVADAGVPADAVLGLPRGGVPVAAPVAAVLDAPLDVLLVRKVGHPRQREFAIGAVGEPDVTWLDPAATSRLPVGDVATAVTRARRELADRQQRYADVRTGVALRGAAVLVVDDGLATGATARVAVEVLRAAGAASVALAVPVASRTGRATLAEVADTVVCLHAPAAFRAVGQFYRDFAATSDEEVRAALRGREAGR